MSVAAASKNGAGVSRAAVAGSDHELLLVRRGPRSDAHVIIAVHSTVLGPALGGCRLWRYSDLDAAVADALRLAGAMTLKAAAAGLTLGGGKSVIFPPAALSLEGADRDALLADFAESLELLDGTYITAEDVGTTPQDMAILSRYSSHVTGAPARDGGSGDPGEQSGPPFRKPGAIVRTRLHGGDGCRTSTHLITVPKHEGVHGRIAARNVCISRPHDMRTPE